MLRLNYGLEEQSRRNSRVDQWLRNETLKTIEPFCGQTRGWKVFLSHIFSNVTKTEIR